MRLRSRRRLSVKAVASYPEPRFPSRAQFGNDPARLLRYIPERWQRCRLAFSALMAFALARTEGALEASPTAQHQSPTPSDQSQTTARSDKTARVEVAPIFVHGEGQGATGCVAIAPPVFLSEAEALDVLWQELEQAQLGFERRPAGAGVTLAEGETQLVFDFFSPELKLGVSFIGAHNYARLAGRSAYACPDDVSDGSRECMSTAGFYDTLNLAERTAERLSKAARYSAGVFYDPLVTRDAQRPFGTAENRRQGLEAQARALLREQVKDFVVWARTQLATEARGR